MAPENEWLVATRATLIARLRDVDDHKSWEEFFDTYWRLIFGMAMKHGLTRVEAEDVLQDTMLTVVKQMPGFKYDSRMGSFKSWLLTTTRWRIMDQFRKRQRLIDDPEPVVPAGDEVDDDPLSKLAQSGPDLEQVWEDEWKHNLLDVATERARRRLSPKQYQAFDLYVNKSKNPEQVAQMLAMSVDQVYLAKHRVTEAIKMEVERLQSNIV